MMTPVKEEPEYDEIIRGAGEEDSESEAEGDRAIVLNEDAFIPNPDTGREAILDQTRIIAIKQQMALNPPNPQARAPPKSKKRAKKSKAKNNENQNENGDANANQNSNSEYQPMSPVNTMMQVHQPRM